MFTSILGSLTSVSDAIKCVLYFTIMLQLVNYLKTDCLEIVKVWLVKFCMFNFKSFSLSFHRISTVLVSKSTSAYALSKTEEILKMKHKTSVLLLIKRRYFFWDTRYSLSCLKYAGANLGQRLVALPKS